MIDMKKEVRIIPPEGYEIDKENSSFEKIVFKKKENTKPRSWEEYCKGYKGDVFWINTFDSSIGQQTITDIMYPQWAKNTLPSKELAEAFRAMMQLMSLRQAWIGDWKPDWNNNVAKWCIDGWGNEITIFDYRFTPSSLSFPTKKIAEDFMNTFKDLLEVAKPLI